MVEQIPPFTLQLESVRSDRPSWQRVSAVLMGDDPLSFVRELQDQFPKANLIGNESAYEDPNYELFPSGKCFVLTIQNFLSIRARKKSRKARTLGDELSLVGYSACSSIGSGSHSGSSLISLPASTSPHAIEWPSIATPTPATASWCVIEGSGTAMRASTRTSFTSAPRRSLHTALSMGSPCVPQPEVMQLCPCRSAGTVIGKAPPRAVLSK